MYTFKTGNSVEYGLSYWVVYDLMQPYLSKITTCTLKAFTRAQSFIICVNRGKLPESVKRAKLEVGLSVSLRKGNILPVHWKVKRDAFLLLSVHDNDQFSSYYPLDLRSLKWCETTLFPCFSNMYRQCNGSLC